MPTTRANGITLNYEVHARRSRFTAHGGHRFRREVPDEFNAAVLEFLTSKAF